jgi:hypothetical protein
VAVVQRFTVSGRRRLADYPLQYAPDVCAHMCMVLRSGSCAACGEPIDRLVKHPHAEALSKPKPKKKSPDEMREYKRIKGTEYRRRDGVKPKGVCGSAGPCVVP